MGGVGAFQIAQKGKNPTAMQDKQEIQFDSWVGKIPLEEGIAWRTPGTEEPRRLHSKGRKESDKTQ